MRIAVIGWLLAAGAVLWGQTFGEITGEVRDASGAVIVGAAVTITNQATGAARSAVTNQSGIYSVPALQPGVYDLRVTMTGFQAATRPDLVLQVQQTARVDFTLQVGQVTEAVEVAGSSALLTTENATVGTVIENKRILELPLNGRNFLQLVSLSPNVSFGFANSGQAGLRQGGARAQQNISLAGQRSMFNRFTLDGMENTDVNFNTYIVLPSIDALQEFKVQSGIYPAEFGRSAGQINVSTKAGTNEFHGALFEFLRNDKLDARNYAFTSNRPPKDPFKWNQYGFTLGGPVWIPRLVNGRNRLFFLSNFEGYRDRKQLRGVFNVPSAAMRRGDFSEIAQRIFDPATRSREGGAITAAAFPGNLIPASRIHPIAVKLLEFYPPPNVNTGSLVSNFQRGQRRIIDKDQFLQRIDLVESNRSSWFGRYSWGDEVQLQEALQLNGSKILTRFQQAMISNTRVLSPSIVNEFRSGWNSFFNSTGRELAFIRDVNGELNLPGMPSPPPNAWGIPEVNISGFSSFGDSTEGPYVNNNHTFQWVDNFSLIAGRHSIRFGGEVRRDRYNQIGNQFPRGELGFEGQATQDPASPSGTGYAFADYMLGLNRRAQGVVGMGFVQFRATGQYYYIDDTWKVRPGLTLHLGLRYEYTPPWFDRSGKLVNVHLPFADAMPNVPDRSRHPTLVRIGQGDFYEGLLLRFNPAINVARDGRLGPRLVESDHNDFAPRLGISWSPSGRWTLRAGAGVFYSQDTGNPRFDMSRNLAGRRNDTSNTDFPDLTLDRPFRNLGTTVQINNPAALGNNHHRRTPYSAQFLINIQRELDRRTVLEAGYLGSVSRKLESYRDYNNPQPAPTGSVASRLPYPEFSRVWLVDGHNKANYHSLGLKVQRRFSQGMTYLVGYTWSKSIDTGSAIRVHDGDTLFPQDSFCTQCERALSSFHTSHRLVTSVLYELPVGQGKRFLNTGGAANALLGGWQLSSIVTLQTGFPVTVMSGTDISNRAIGTDRPNATGDRVALPRGHQDPERFFNTAAFVLQPVGALGNVGRNTLIGPGIIAWDLSTLKNFRVREGHDIQLRFEAFNLPNHPNWGLPNTSRISPGFGTIRSTRTDMRDLQFALKYLF
jgi:hypothetical protein